MTASNLAWQRDIRDYVSDRGRIPQEIRDAYAVADSGAAPACSEERRSLRESGRGRRSCRSCRYRGGP
ncbi:Lsr2 family DNA-binding protein [Brachybacterium tyrofermentans]|uniref:Lsr2 family DNA-binding protein n=1 Tax=Brachybacterium tyrofermentans TaxID=47848 RepID=UPI003FD27DE4